MREYDDVTLKKVQELEFGILKEFDSICRKEGFAYYIDGGSLLGAIRHKGFIPWDDDIDVSMPRTDYNRFLKYAEANLTDRYNIINIDHYDNYPLITTQLALKDTSFVVEPFKDIIGIPFGIYLDIFPLDNAADDNVTMRKQTNMAFFLSKIMILANIKKPYIPFSGVVEKILHFGTTVVHYLLRIFGVKGKDIYKKISELTHYDENTRRVVTLCQDDPRSLMNKRRDVFPTIPVEFCGINVRAPKNYDKYLRHYYGDYMQLPPEDKRKNHFPYRLDFGPYK